MVTEVIYQPKYLEKTAIADFRIRMEKLNDLYQKYHLFDNKEFVMQSIFTPITPEFALAAGHKEVLLKDIDSTGFLDVALLHCGGVVQAVDDIMSGKCTNAFAVIPVGGHHAGPSSHWGFCYLNDIACATYQARTKYHAQKILYIDQDFHHGDGTEKFFRYDKDFFYIDAHGQKAGEQPGAKIDKENTYVDITMPKGIGGGEFASVIREGLDFALNKMKFKPELIIAYCGFDAHVLDGFNKGVLRVDYQAFVELANVYRRLAESFCDGRLLCIGGGGYNDKYPEVSAICTFNTIAMLAKRDDLILEKNAPLEQTDPIAKIKVNSIMRDFTRARF
jgi:acetoin utilization deacetylase AcuC-like enzyme